MSNYDFYQIVLETFGEWNVSTLLKVTNRERANLLTSDTTVRPTRMEMSQLRTLVTAKRTKMELALREIDNALKEKING